MLVLVFSSNAESSENVVSEVQLAKEAGKTILPVRIENVAPVELEYWLLRTQWIDAYNGAFENHLENVVQQLMPILRQKLRAASVAPAQRVDAEPEESEPEESPSEEEIQHTQAASQKLAQSGRVPFEQVWQALVKKVKDERKWLLPGLGWSEYRVSFTRKGGALGENVGGAGTTYSAPKDRVEQVWVGMGQDVKVTNKSVQDIIGKSAHTGFIGSIVEELRRLETELKPQTPLPPITPFNRAWQIFTDKVRGDSNWLLPAVGSGDFHVWLSVEGDVLGEKNSFRGAKPWVVSRRDTQAVWEKLSPNVKATNEELRDIVEPGAPTSLIGAIIKELRRLQVTPPQDSFEEAWQKFVRQAESQPQRLLASTGASQFRVSMAPRGGVLGENVNGNTASRYSASKESIEQVWTALKPEVMASPTAVQDILGKGAHFGLIGAIVQEMRRLQTEPLKATSTCSFEEAWQKLVRSVESEPNRLLDSEPIQFRLSLSTRGNVLGINANGRSTTHYTASKQSMEEIWNTIKPGEAADGEDVEKILSHGYFACAFMAAVLAEMRQPQKSA